MDVTAKDPETVGARHRASAVVFALFSLDMMFLPMFHVADFPVKPFYLILAFSAVTAVTVPGVRTITFLSWSIFGVFLFGGLWLSINENSAQLSQTVRDAIIWFLAPLAFAFGWRMRLVNANFLLVLIPCYFLLNVALTIGYQQLPGLIAFYGLQEWVESGLFLIRSPGIHFNANLSSLAMNLLFLGVVAGESAGLITVRNAAARWITFLSVIGLHLLTASRGEMGAALALGLAWIYYSGSMEGSRNLSRFVFRTILAGILFIPLFVHVVNRLAETYPAFEFVQHQFTGSIAFRDESYDSPSERLSNSPFLRPFLEREQVFDRFSASPIWGSGFDIGTPYPFDHTYFHNDWAVVLTGGGIIAVVLVLFLLSRLNAVAMIFLVPFVFTSPFNTFVLAPQHMTFYFAIAGLVAANRRRRMSFERPSQRG